MKKCLIGAAGLGLAFALGGAGAAFAADPLKVGVLATLEGTYTVLGEDGVRGFNVALKKFGGMAGGREVEVVIGATDASPDSAIRAAPQGRGAGQGRHPSSARCPARRASRSRTTPRRSRR